MSATFIKDLRNTKTSFGNRTAQSARSTSQGFRPQSSVINYQKREKLRELLVAKFMKKYRLNTYEPLINEEVAYFLQKETLTDNDLKNLDKKIDCLLKKKSNINNLANQLQNEDNSNNYKERAKTSKPVSKRGDDEVSVRSGISGASRLSNVNAKKRDLTEEDFDLLSEKAEPIERVQFQNEKDEWNAINKYNQKAFEQDKLEEMIKDKEIKRRTKEDLDNQIKQKLLRLNEEKLKAKEYDEIAINHVAKMNKLENEKMRELKEKMQREKENRDAQRMDEHKKRKIEQIKNKKFDKELRKSLIITLIIS